MGVIFVSFKKLVLAAIDVGLSDATVGALEVVRLEIVLFLK